MQLIADGLIASRPRAAKQVAIREPEFILLRTASAPGVSGQGI